MTRRARSTIFGRSIQRTIKALTHSAIRAGAKAVKQALQPGKPVARKRLPPKATVARPKLAAAVKLLNGFMAGDAGAQRYRLFVPLGVRQTGRVTHDLGLFDQAV